MKHLKNAWALMSLITYLLPFALYGAALLSPPLYAAISGAVAIPLWLLAGLAYFTLAFGVQLALITWQDSHPGFKVNTVANVRLFQASAKERYLSFILYGTNQTRQHLGFTGFSLDGTDFGYMETDAAVTVPPGELMTQVFDKMLLPEGVNAIRLIIHLTNGKIKKHLISVPSKPV